MKESLKIFFYKNKPNIVSISSVAIFITTTFIVTNFSYIKTAYVIVSVAIIPAVAILMTVGFPIMKALFHISAGLSLIIFLAQSYCSTPYRTNAGDNALIFLLIIGLIYLIIDFIYTFYKDLLDIVYPLIFNKQIKSRFWKIMIEIYLLLMIFGFLWAMYQVMKPILLDLCIADSFIKQIISILKN